MVAYLFDNKLFEFESILNKMDIKTLFQPIISLKDGELLGYEALSRGPSNSDFESAINLFGAAERYGRVWELEKICRIKAVERAASLGIICKLFLNVNPKIILDQDFKKGFTYRLLDEYGMDARNIVFEITEGTSIDDYKLFREALNYYVKQGFKIAIDDLGEGYAGLKVLAEAHPHYMKIDMSLVRDIEKKPLNQALIRAFIEFGKASNIKLIAEGIETEAELGKLIELGADYGQGYYLHRPTEHFGLPNNSVIHYISSKNKIENKFIKSSSNDILVGDICRFDESVHEDTINSVVYEIFKEKYYIYGLVVVDSKNVPIGMVTRSDFFAKLATQFGTAVYMKRNINLLMKKYPITIDRFTSLTEAADIAIGRREEDIYDYLIVTEQNKYIGVITIRDLLERLSNWNSSFFYV